MWVQIRQGAHRARHHAEFRNIFPISNSVLACTTCQRIRPCLRTLWKLAGHEVAHWLVGSLPSTYRSSGLTLTRSHSLTCRQRKLKCDETKPVCGQCQKANRLCQASTGITFRHQHNASMNSTTDGGNALNGFYAYKNTFDDKTTWVAIPKDLTFYNITDPYSDDPGTSMGDAQVNASDQSQYIYAQEDPWIAQEQSRQPSDINAHGLEALSAAALYSPSRPKTLNQPRSPPSQTDSYHSAMLKTHDPASLISSPTAEPPSNTLKYVLNSSSADSPIDPSLTSPETPRSNVPSQDVDDGIQQKAVDGVESEHKIAYLLRHFSEVPGQWVGNQQTYSNEGS